MSHWNNGPPFIPSHYPPPFPPHFPPPFPPPPLSVTQPSTPPLSITQPHPPSLSATQPPPPPRVPQQFMAAMKRVASADAPAAQTQPEATTNVTGPVLSSPVLQVSVEKWKSSFKPIGGELESSENPATKRVKKWDILYDPYSPVNSDSDGDMLKDGQHGHSTPCQGNNLERRGVPVTQAQDPTYSEAASQPTDSRNPEPESLDRLGFGSIAGVQEKRACSPERRLHSSSTHRFPPPYGGQATNGEEHLAGQEYRPEIATTVRLSPLRIQRDYQRDVLSQKDKGVNKALQPTTPTRNGSKVAVMDQSSITCDLCDVIFANSQELFEHLDSKTHWDTLEHIQQVNGYDDVAIAFLQEVMLYKSHQCSRAVEDSALKALQEKDYMTKVEMLHCAACKVFVSTSAAEVHTHVASREHISNTKDFEVEQRRTCLTKAETMMQELKPQLQLFLEGGSPFDSM